MSFVYLFGVDHRLQYDLAITIEQDRQQKCFAEDLNSLIRGLQFDCYCEEALHGHESILERHAKQASKTYCNIEMSPELRAEHGIPVEYGTSPGNYPQPDFEAWNKLREEYMLARILDCSRSHARILVLCGEGHRDALFSLCRQKGLDVDGKSGLGPWWDSADWK